MDHAAEQALYAPFKNFVGSSGRALADLEMQLRRGIAGLSGARITCPRLTWSPRLTRSSGGRKR
jgi:hypothetical protein